jgi:DNA-binding GntR family transcriptional regulator
MNSPILLAEKIATQLQSEIIRGIYLPGARLVEREIASRFQVSSIPVREALQMLASRGLATARPNRGYVVIQLTAEELEQMSELRILLEPKLMEWAASRRKPAGVEKLRKQLMRLKQAAEDADTAQFFQEDLSFHRIAWELAENRIAAKSLEMVVGAMFACGLRQANLDLLEQYKKHEDLFQAIAKGNPDDARKLLADISTGFRAQLYRALELPR